MGKDLNGKELGKGLSQRKDGYYIGRFVDRFGRRQEHYSKKVRECSKWLADKRYEDEHSNINVLPNLTVDKWTEYVINIKKRTNKKGSIEVFHNNYYTHISPVIGNMIISDVKSLHCQNVLNIMADSPDRKYKSSTIDSVRRTMHNIFEIALDNEVILTNPCKKSVKANIGEVSIPRIAMTLEQQKRFLRFAKDSYCYNQFAFILQTGLRAGELIALTWSDIDFDKKILYVSHSMRYDSHAEEWIVGSPKSEKGYRTIPLTTEAINILKKQRELADNQVLQDLKYHNLVFLNRVGKPIYNSNYNNILIQICRNANIPPISMHILRHTFATRCAEAGMQPKILQMILGHATISMTMDIYVHATEEKKIEEISMVEDSLKIC